LDEALVLELAEQHDLLVTLEENVVAGGAGSAVTEFLNASLVTMPVLQLGLPDRFVEHGKHEELLEECGLNAAGIREAIARRLEQLGYPGLTAAK
ncbi:MAG TPA: 1-deoxy-D-xylulose-5-phosphate synthase, partial [Marinobacter sp.]|nr:1-deoxy-D-xylulose-5-phosphate synthase [Marinobacter sp.]